MPQSSNIVTVVLDALFAMINIALSIVFSYLSTLATFALAGLVAIAALFGVFTLVRALRR